MKSKIVCTLTAALIALGPLSSALPALAAPQPPGPNPISISEDVRDWEANAAHLDLSAEALDEVSAEPTTTATPLTDCTLDSKIFLILNDFLGAYQLTFFNLVAESDQSQVWVQANLAWPAGDPRATPQIFCEQAEYMLGQFDDNIHPIEIDFFGPPDAHDGSGALLPVLVPSLGLPADYYADSAGRQIVLVSNVRDDNYYDSTYPLYIAGFYSSTLEAYFDRNVMSIDAFDWANRTGPSGTRPFLYEGVFAHEYQHLIHHYSDPDEVNWVNEGLSDFTEVITGYVDLSKHVDEKGYDSHTNAFLGWNAQTHPDWNPLGYESGPENGLAAWGDQGDDEILADYGFAMFFMNLVHSQGFGRDFFHAWHHTQADGIAGMNAALAAVGFAYFLPQQLLFSLWAFWEGVVLGAIYLYTDSLPVTMAVHAAHDIAGFTLFSLQRRRGFLVLKKHPDPPFIPYH